MLRPKLSHVAIAPALAALAAFTTLACDAADPLVRVNIDAGPPPSTAADAGPPPSDAGPPPSDAGPPSSDADVPPDAGTSLGPRGPCDLADPALQNETFTLSATASSVQLATDTRGYAAVFWQTANTIQCATFDPSSRIWSAPLTLTSTIEHIVSFAVPDRAVEGAVAVAFVPRHEPTQGEVLARFSVQLEDLSVEPVTHFWGGWSPVVTFSNLRVRSNGRQSMISWNQFNSSPPPIVDRGSSFGFVVLLDGQGPGNVLGLEPADQASAALAGTGDIFLLWSEGQTEVTGRLGPTLTHSSWGPTNVVGLPWVSANAGGDALATWETGGSAAGARYLLDQNRWDAIMVPRPGSPLVGFGLADSGDAVAAWAGDGVTTSRFDGRGATWTRPFPISSSPTSAAAFAFNGSAPASLVWVETESTEIHGVALTAPMAPFRVTTAAAPAPVSVATTVGQDGTRFAAWSTGRCIGATVLH
jgi:hypothetical protein